MVRSVLQIRNKDFMGNKQLGFDIIGQSKNLPTRLVVRINRMHPKLRLPMGIHRLRTNFATGIDFVIGYWTFHVSVGPLRYLGVADFSEKSLLKKIQLYFIFKWKFALKYSYNIKWSKKDDK